MTAHDCVILAIDPGAVSGWAVFIRGERRSSGRIPEREPATLRLNRHDVVMMAKDAADNENLPLVVVAEKWTAGGWASHLTLVGLGAAWGEWRAALDRWGVPKRRVVRVYSQTWRAAVIGGRQRSTEKWKASARLVAQAQCRTLAIDDDQAEAICIGLWALRAEAVAKVLPKPRKRKVA